MLGRIGGMANPESPSPSWLQTSLADILSPSAEKVAILILILLAFVSRFYNLDARVMSHDEVNHVVPSYDLYNGLGYRYDPLSHGPLQFHLIALSYFIFGDGDFSSRIPAATFSVVTIVLAVFLFRRYFGRWGALVAGTLFLISPYMLFYGRYARNEAFIVLWGLLTIYAILRYLERGDRPSLILFVLVNALHFTDKATSHIFAAEQLVFLAAYFVDRLLRRPWNEPGHRRQFLLSLIGVVVMFSAAFVLSRMIDPAKPVMLISIIAAALLGLGGLVFAILALVHEFAWDGIRGERSFDLLIVLGSLILPLLSALPVSLSGNDPLDYSTNGLIRSGIVIAVLGGIGIALGLWWNRNLWPKLAILFYVPFVILYTTFFTNSVGLMGGFTGALGYWMEQQAVNRGSQPLYYYALVQLPVYEFLPALGTLLAIVIAWRNRLWESESGRPFVRGKASDRDLRPAPVAALTIYWSIVNLIAFSVAGEKMPWLTVHIAQPMILAAGWAVGWLIEAVDWRSLQAWSWRTSFYSSGLAVFTLLAVLTVRTSFRAAYINYDYPLEYLVYAHAARDPKTVFHEIEELSQRTTGGLGMIAAYDNNVRYPYWWYMRHYPNRIDFDVNPTAEIKNASVIVVSSENDAKVAPILRSNYYSFKYMRMWWPNQDYWSIKWESIDAEYHQQTGNDAPPLSVAEYLRRVWGHISPFFTDPQVRSAVWQIWFNRDYSEYAAIKGTGGFTLTDWNPADTMNMYIRKDIVTQIWNYGMQKAQVVDPYESAQISLKPDVVLGEAGAGPGQFQAPRSLAVAADGSLYVADSRNHRIQHISVDGRELNVWGTFKDIATGDAPGGTFNEPWGIAVGPDGSVYVADTWNHRIQKFTAEGQFIKMWGYFGQGDQPDAFYGPRGLTVDAAGRVYVADTGNKRIVVFDSQGEYVTQFGSSGLTPGQFDEPVGVALDSAGNVYVSDTWNQRIQVFTPDATGLNFMPLNQWDVVGWFGQSLENKPFITVDNQGRAFVPDPEVCRVLEFSAEGEILHVWTPCADGTSGVLNGVATDSEGGLWVSDAANNKLYHFVIPQE
jgi:predicted membrane-bound mannosyltransferase/DNA-binding beta-propeller fold protein YncE